MGGTRSLRDAVLGAAIGDALGLPFEFQQRGTFECTGMVGGGTWQMPAGTYSDDTALMLATCDSLKSRNGKFDEADLRERYIAAIDQGRYSVDGKMFDVGTVTAQALLQPPCAPVASEGNGALVRLVPLAFAQVDEDAICRAVEMTHTGSTVREAGTSLVRALRALAAGVPVRRSVETSLKGLRISRTVAGALDAGADSLPTGEQAVATLQSAYWCLLHTQGFSSCLLSAVNLGGDCDTVGSVTGALAGVAYGVDSIPGAWMHALRGRDLIEAQLP